ncbi:hypothetical protein [Flagellimonas sp.]|uniref:hypothetical protein n=1 Tax=Flagellimonas sp. TaxID=2058762 RepID=UPI003B59CE01
MKTIWKGILCLWILCSCSSDSSDEEASILEPNFKFEISGAINTTMSGNGIVYNETTTQAVNANGDDVNITTILVIAQDRGSDNHIVFGVTLEGSKVGTGDYAIGTDILKFYNAFMNFSGDRGKTISYQSASGSINFDSRLLYTTGTVDVNCPGVGGGGTVTVKGSFQAENVN